MRETHDGAGLSRREALQRIGGLGAAVLAAPSALRLEDALTRVHSAQHLSTRAAGGTLRIAAAQNLAQLDPFKYVFDWDNQTLSCLYSGLTQFTAGGGPVPQPAMAQHWTVSSDLTTYTFHLRKNLLSSRGKPITAPIIVASIKRALSPSTAYYGASFFPPIKRITTPDNRTIIFSLGRPCATLATWLTTYMPITMPGTTAEAGSPHGPDTTGPWKVQEFVSDNYMYLVPNEHWWGASVKLSKIEVITAQDNTSAVTSLQAGALDVLWGTPYSDIAHLKHNPNFRVVTSHLPGTSHTYEVDILSPPFNNVNNRLAMAYAVDRKTIVEAAYAGLGQITSTNVPVATNSRYFNPHLPHLNYDLDKAKALFKAGGLTKKDTLTFWCASGQYPEWIVAGEIIQADLAKIGINMVVRPVDISTWVAKFFPKGKHYPGYVVANFGTAGPDVLALERLDPKVYEGNWNDPTVQTLMAKAQETSKFGQADGIYKQVELQFSKQAPATSLMMFDNPALQSTKVAGTWIAPNGNCHFEHCSKS
jgi:peptide/nickel transport system substrate-binding protein